MYTKMKDLIKQEIEIPEGIEVKVDNNIITIKGSKGEISRNLVSRKVNLSIEEKKIIVSTKNKATKREKAVVGTFTAHIKNMIKGANEGHTYKLKICSGHFPMNVSISGEEFIVKNFLGESIPRKLKINKEVSVKIEDKDVVVESINKELAGQTASSIEELTKRKGFDTRIFQDGIYIYFKDGKVIE